MSTKYKKWGEVPCAVLAERLRELADAVSKCPEVRDREFTRRVPAELDRDADLVLEQSAEAMDHMAFQRDQLREALEDMLSGWRYIREAHGDLYGVGWDRAEEQARDALKATEEG